MATGGAAMVKASTATDAGGVVLEPHLDPVVVAKIVDALVCDDRDALLSHVSHFHAADIADLIEQLPPQDRRQFARMLGPDLPPDALPELEEGVRDEVLDVIEPEVLVRAVSALDSDGAVYLLEDLEPAQRLEVLRALKRGDRVAVEQALGYPDDSAGRMMQREVVTAPPFWTVGQMIDLMRLESELPQQFYVIFVVDPARRPVGVIPLGRLMATRRHVGLEAIMSADIRSIRADDPQEEVAYLFNQYHLVSAPVVDNAGRLVGAINIDDAMGALDEQAEEDIHRLGSVGDEEITDSVAKTAVRRFPWLAANLATAVLSSLVISIFDETISRLVALAVLMPIVASMGGIAGTQTLTVAVRALAARDITGTNAARVVMREALVGVANGLAFALIVAVIAYFWYGNAMLGAVLGFAMIMNLIVAALSGILVPLGCERVGADPALASGTFVTTVTDVVGFFIFLGLGSWLLL